MKMLLLAMMFAAGGPAFAADAIFGSWYNAYAANDHESYSPEALSKISEDGTITWEVVFQGAKQKQVVVFKSTVTAETIQTVEVLRQTECPNTHFTMDAVPRNYKVEGDVLNVDGMPKLRRATEEQSRHFAELTEGCL